MKKVDANPAEALPALRAVLQASALDADQQLALFPEPDCVNCRIPTQYGEWAERYGPTGVLDQLDASRAAALKRVEAAASRAWEGPCHEPQLLIEKPFQDLRKAANKALAAFGWSPGPPDCSFLCGRDEYAALREAEQKQARDKRRAKRRTIPRASEFQDIPEFDPRGLSVDAFRKMIDRVPWFENLGKPHPLDATVDRIHDWEEWPGPESRGGSFMGPEGGRWQDELLALERPGPEAIRSLWSSVEKQALGRMPLEMDGDPWDGPTAAGIFGAWAAATIACCLLAGAPIPANALRQWAWFARGHWPSHYSEDDDFEYDSERRVIQASLDRARLVVF